MTDTLPTYCWHMHHMQLVEREVEPLEVRIQYIKQTKPKDEIETRLRLIKRVQNQRLIRRLLKHETDYTTNYQKICDEHERKRQETGNEEFEAKMEKLNALGRKKDAAAKKARSLIEALHKKECPNCPWNGSTIFPGKKYY